MLDTLENLESIDTWGEAWKVPSGKVYPKLKYLKISTHFADKSKPESLVKVFPNLEYLYIADNYDNSSSSEAMDSLYDALLCGLKRLQTLHMSIRSEIDYTYRRSHYAKPLRWRPSNVLKHGVEKIK